MKHAPVAPSGLDLTVACPGSVTLQARMPPLPMTDEQAEGHAAHWIALRYAAGYARELSIGTKFKSCDTEWEVDEDMAAGAMLYLRSIGGFHGNNRLEDPVPIKRVHELCYGTPDMWRFVTDAREFYLECPPEIPREAFDAGRIKVIVNRDYKYGHRYVEVFENFQLSAYLAGVMELLGLSDNDEYLYFDTGIVQPRCYHKDGPVRTWRGHTAILRAALNIAASAAQEALGAHPRTITNDRCIDCLATTACKTLHYATAALIDFSSKAEVLEIPSEALGQELAMAEDAIKLLEARVNGLRAQTEALLRQGVAVNPYHMEQGSSRLVYKDDVSTEEIVGLGELINIDLRKPVLPKNVLVTPTQAIQMGVDEGIMKQYSFRPPGALKLARDESQTARKVFAK